MRKTFLFLFFLPISNLFAQALEPRLYTSVNFLVAGYTYSQGASSGIFTRAGSNFDTLGFFLQYSFIDKD